MDQKVTVGKTEQTSWKTFLTFYAKIKFPWHLLIATVILSFSMTQVNLLLVPYTAKIYEGGITEANFLQGFILWSVAYAGVTFAFQLVSGFVRIIAIRNTQRNLWSKILRLPISTYDKEQPQSLISRITSDTESAVSAPTSVASFFASCYGLVMAYLEMNKIYDKLAFLILFVIPFAFVIIFIIGKLQYRMNFAINKAYSRMTSFFAERLANMQYIKTANVENEEYQSGIQASQIKYKADVLNAILGTLQTPIGLSVQYAIMIIVFAGGASYVRSGEMQIKGLVEFYSYSMILLPSFFEIVSQWQNIKSSHGGTYKIAALMNMENELLKGKFAADKDPSDIQFDHVSFTYDGEHQVLSDISMTIPHGKVTAIVGENGSGKSSILKLISRFYEPGAGEIKYGQQRLSDLYMDEWRNSIGYVSQNSPMIPGTLRENVVYGAVSTPSEEELERAARIANVLEFITELKDGWDTPLSLSQTNISGGQKQRIAIARAIIKNPNILLLDEATSNLDNANQREVMQALLQAMKGRTIIMIMHDMELVHQADHIIVMNKGSVESQGTYKELLEQCESFKTFIELQKG
ncbi:ABC transporter ATP-binding protein [Paenibacillus lautus]|uniref:ABC transporter ATP-binding protein n=1 Tax=Paenibacillus lautus TaxID=1401 RepID=UPI001C7CF9B7|nr:ABC transporter ATP-binding protein [Paenibacillus lautus]MBX4152298.1 ABC transporter ATP-binding protein/permease [Paenibacillus lautus]